MLLNERETLEKLINNSAIIIRQVDKGGSLVIQNRDDYLAEAMRLLEMYRFMNS